jgi:hypothetical protein
VEELLAGLMVMMRGKMGEIPFFFFLGVGGESSSDAFKWINM